MTARHGGLIDEGLRSGTCDAGPERWEVTQRHGNASAFNGYRWQPSAYSQVRCTVCGRTWRTKGAYADDLPSAPADWYAR